MTEVWKPVLGYEGLYEVSNHGRVRSVDRVVAHAKSGKVTRKGRMLVLSRHHTGYMVVGLARGNKGRQFRVHRLVLEAFRGPPPYPQAHGSHLNDQRDDNRVESLLWESTHDNLYRHHRTRSSSTFSGVSWNQRMKKWVAATRFNGKPQHIGCFDDEIEAARARDSFILSHNIQNRRLNFDH